MTILKFKLEKNGIENLMSIIENIYIWIYYGNYYSFMTGL